jgi:opacity protein-like surface antigen
VNALKNTVVAALFVFLLPASAAAQSSKDPSTPPFYQTYGGLFYPTHSDFRETFDAASDFIWGTGFGLPITGEGLFLVIDLSWSKAKAYVPGQDGLPDADAEVSYSFWHFGLLDKPSITEKFALRFQAGVNYNHVETETTVDGSPTVKTELKRKFAFYGGAGAEHFIAEGRMGLFVDLLYDYRRSTDRQIYGDFGGVRLVAGISAYLF